MLPHVPAAKQPHLSQVQLQILSILLAMGPVRTEKRKRRDETRNSQDGVSELKRQKKRPKLAHESSGGSGIQKLKSSLRQTRRLLAKVLLFLMSCFAVGLHTFLEG